MRRVIVSTPLRLCQPQDISWDDYRLLVDSIEDYAIFVLDAGGHVASWNRGAEKIKGYGAREIIGRHFSTFYPPEDIAAGRPEELLQLARVEGRAEYEGWRVRKDGSRFWASVVLTALYEESGLLRGFGKVTRDLTARSRAEAELRQAEQRFRALVDGFPDHAMIMLDTAGSVLTWNAGAKKITAYEQQEVLGKHFGLLYAPEELATRSPEQALEIARSSGRFAEDGWRIRKDGTRFWASVILTPVRDDQGKPMGFAQLMRDLTEHRHKEEALHRSEERFRLLVEGVVDYALYMLDPQGRVTTWNLGAERIKGYRAEEIIGKHFSAFFPEEAIRSGAPARELLIAEEQGRFEDEAWRVRKDGSRFWANVILTAIHDAQGRLLGFTKVTRDLTARRQAEETARALLREQTRRAAAEQSGKRLRESEERSRALSTRLEVILEGVADGITAQDRSGRVIFANTAAARVCGFSSVEEFLATSPKDVMDRFVLCDEEGRRFRFEDLPGAKVLRGEPGGNTAIHVRERRSNREWWSLVRASSVRGADGAPELAINIWHDITAERRRKQHDSYLAQATAALSSSLDYDAMLSTLASLLVPGLGDWCSIHLLEGDELRNVVVAHVDPAKVALARDAAGKYPPDRRQPRGVWNVIRTGQSELYRDVPDELLVHRAQDAAHLELLRGVGVKSVVIAPIWIRDRVCGAMSLVSSDEARRYDAYDVELMEELGRRVGTAVENGRLYAAEKAARERLALLAKAGDAFFGAQTYEETLRNVVGITVPALGDFSFIDVVEGEQIRRVAAIVDDVGADLLLEEAEWPSSATDKSPFAPSSRRTEFHPNIDDTWLESASLGRKDLDVLRRHHPCSMIKVPLRTREGVLGALTLCFGRSGRHHTPDDLNLAEELARRATAAVQQIRLYRSAQESACRAELAARRAEEASRTKDEFLATVSHELRTPLSAIVGWSSLLRDRTAEPAVVKGIDVIYRNAQAQAKIIEDILDVSRMITGKLRLDLKPADLIAIVRDAIEVVRPSAAAKRVFIDFTPPDRDCLMVADPERLQQVVWNLLSNAVKFTEPGGRMAVAIEQRGSTLVLRVTDSGQGIEPEFLPFVFERFKQGDSSTTRRVGGLGLGLSIVRHIVELHGGQVSAESEGQGRGATFTITLPIRATAPAAGENELPSPSSVKRARQVAEADAALRGLRVLVVDDESDARDLLQAVLEDAGALVETAACASEGVDSIRRFRPHVLVSDIAMPEEDGLSFMARVRSLDASSRSLPSIALTAYTRAEDKTRALAAGYTTHIGKPVNPEDLVTAVENLAAFVQR